MRVRVGIKEWTFPCRQTRPRPEEMERGEGDPKERGKGLGWGSFFCRAQIAVPGQVAYSTGVEDGTAFQGPSDRPPVPTRTRVRAQCAWGPEAAPPSYLCPVNE
jgi:hypothetical protein